MKKFNILQNYWTLDLSTEKPILQKKHSKKEDYAFLIYEMERLQFKI